MCDQTTLKNETGIKKNIKLRPKHERKLLKACLLSHLYQLFCHSLPSKALDPNLSNAEYYVMDSQIIQLLIQGILNTEEYTLEGIAYHTRIPFDVIYDAACGISNQFSMTPWARVVDLYLKVYPDVTQIVVDKLLAIKNQHHNFSLLLNEEI